MTIPTEFETTRALQAVALRASAEHTLATTSRPLNLLVATVVIACTAVTFAFAAARAEPVFRVIVAGAAGAALALGSLALAESRRLRRRLDAALVLSRHQA